MPLWVMRHGGPGVAEQSPVPTGFCVLCGQLPPTTSSRKLQLINVAPPTLFWSGVPVFMMSIDTLKSVFDAVDASSQSFVTASDGVRQFRVALSLSEACLVG